MEDDVLDHIKKVGCATVYELAKTFNITYGRMQWYLYKLVKTGLVRTVKIGRHRYVLYRGRDLTECVKIGDLLEELRAKLSQHGVSEAAPLREVRHVLRGHLPEACDLFKRLLDGR